ncbi:MAG TPA: hypothetical protein VF338_09465 [Leptolinea sp.]
MIEGKKFSLVRPTVDTHFHIDFDWWMKNDNNWRVYLHDCLCSEHQAAFSNYEEVEMIDWVDPETAEIQKVDGLQHILITHCAKQPDFVTANTSLVDAVFRVFLADGNLPLSPNELATKVSRPAETILRTLAGPVVYKGLRPFRG